MKKNIKILLISMIGFGVIQMSFILKSSGHQGAILPFYHHDPTLGDTLSLKILGERLSKKDAAKLNIILGKQPGVISSRMNYELASVRIVYDARQTGSTRIKELINDFKSSGEQMKYNAVIN